MYSCWKYLPGEIGKFVMLGEDAIFFTECHKNVGKVPKTLFALNYENKESKRWSRDEDDSQCFTPKGLYSMHYMTLAFLRIFSTM